MREGESMEPIKADTQYGDLKGTISLDGWDGLSVLGAGGCCPKGYWPVGLQFYGEPINPGAEIEYDACVFAVDTSILDPGHPATMVSRYAKEHGQIPVFRFDAKVSLEVLLKSCKRVAIVLADKSLHRAPMYLADGDNTHYADEEE